MRPVDPLTGKQVAVDRLTVDGSAVDGLTVDRLHNINALSSCV